mgnify:CR=1 FL=1
MINDNTSPDISFVNQRSSNDGNNLILKLPLLDNFDILNDVSFGKTLIATTNNIPYINYNDNSLYDGNLDYNIETRNNITGNKIKTCDFCAPITFDR